MNLLYTLAIYFSFFEAAKQSVDTQLNISENSMNTIIFGPSQKCQRLPAVNHTVLLLHVAYNSCCYVGSTSVKLVFRQEGQFLARYSNLRLFFSPQNDYFIHMLQVMFKAPTTSSHIGGQRIKTCASDYEKLMFSRSSARVCYCFVLPYGCLYPEAF